MSDHTQRLEPERGDGTKPWPLFVALGLAGSEVGIVVGLGPVAVAGLVVFAASLAGILVDAGYVDRPLPFAAKTGAAFVAVGAILAAHGTGTVSIALLEPLTGLASRGVALLVAGIATLVGAGLLWTRRPADERPDR
ncbi:hypothetical protein A6E15_11930 [Natrinema saccharevitans]|uniref:Cox cluster protein n=1 Tax=Natrinema saccharevitans TaxID=301967 RepID=A0A1S8AXS2_9EURY|nr:hypothetical protein [Natrinema saccharevitans]OLZ41648.1 hypothetical protein A6E15_11930 [Natrinema saccharevitans]